MENLLAMILAGGQGSRLQPLTRDRAKPAVHFAGKYRVIDFVLNNFVNSGHYRIKVLTQFKSDSLNRHVATAWDMNRNLDQYVDLVPAQMRMGASWYMGTADAIYQNVNLIRDVRPDHVAIFGGDHIYKMDINQMLEYHVRKAAVATISAIPVPIEEAAGAFGVLEVDEDGRMIGFEEKPAKPKPMPGRPGWALASMGNYIFNSKFLVRELLSDSEIENSQHDFGRDILPSIYSRYPGYVYDFNTNRIRGESETSLGYWRDIGTLDAFYDANMDICAVSPVFNLYNSKWPLRTVNWNLPPAKFVFGKGDPDKRRGIAEDSIVSEGCILSGGRSIHSVLSPGCRIHSFASVSHSILFPNVDVGRGAKIQRAIIEKGVQIPPGFEVGVNLEKDRERFYVTETGIVVIAKDTIIE
ncbi:MAG TPA: glucose-1-phosphate adenylyltransferase [Fibrobacteres bacterium]|nr:glucose-1-phosphate adenylyltransferase [Fibrobacterota bacterium]